MLLCLSVHLHYESTYEPVPSYTTVPQYLICILLLPPPASKVVHKPAHRSSKRQAVFIELHQERNSDQKRTKNKCCSGTARSVGSMYMHRAAVNYLRIKNVSTYTSMVYSFAYAGSTNLVYAYKLFSKNKICYFLCQTIYRAP